MKPWLRHAFNVLATGSLVTVAAFQAGAPAAAQAAGQTLTILQSAAPVSLNPIQEEDWNSRESIGYMYDPLIYAGPNNAADPGLAMSWKSSDHGMIWTIQLRKGVQFQDGTPFNAAAAVYNFDLCFNPKAKCYSDFKPWFKSVTAEGQYTIKITMAKPYAEVLSTLTWTPLMVSPTAYKKDGPTKFAENPVGTGAYDFSSYAPNSTLLMTANPNYWGGKPKIGTIKVEIVPDLNTEAVDMESHRADFMYNPLPSDVAELKSHGVKIVTTPTASGTMMSFNDGSGPTADVNVRKAIMYAINRKAIVQVVLKGYADLTLAGVPKTSSFFHAGVQGYNFSPKKADQVLTADGWTMGKSGVREKDGQPLDITILSNSNQPWPEISTIFQQELAKVGIKATITSQAWATFLNSMRAGDYNVAYWYLAGFTMDSWDGTVNMNSGNYWNVSQIQKNSALKTAMAQINKIYDLEIGQTNSAQRSATLLKFQKLDAQYMFVGWLWTPLAIFAVSPDVHNYAFNNWLYLFLNQKSFVQG